jgi:cobyrinic acid a,c-diamide synthase
MPPCPTLVIAGTQSGSGKTSLTLALTCALRRRGLAVQTFKVGPDFLDPTYLALASGRPCHNLDGWMAGREAVRRLYERATADADVALVEGVMGLFDGADPATDEGSTAEIARWLAAPLLLVAGVHGMARSLAALVKGFAAFAPDLTLAGVVANRCGSERHAAWLAEALRSAGLPPLAGAIPRGGFPELASRHLGLVSADEGTLPPALREALADAAERHLDLASLFALPPAPAPAPAAPPPKPAGGSAPEPASPLTNPAAPPAGRAALPPADGAPEGDPGIPASAAPRGYGLPGSTGRFPLQAALFPAGDAPADPAPGLRRRSGNAGRVERSSAAARPLKIGVARDAAFHFYYQALFDALAAAGAETVFFSPLTESRLPEGLSGLYLGGGYPEAHAARLSANGEMLAAIRAYAESGRPLYSECGGLIYLSRGLATGEGFFPLLGILPAATRMLPRKKALGYVEVTLREDSLWGRRGEVFRGHEFHYSELDGDPAADPAWRRVYALGRRRAETIESEGFQKGAILASYAHLYYAAQPAAVAHFVTLCAGGTP